MFFQKKKVTIAITTVWVAAGVAVAILTASFGCADGSAKTAVSPPVTKSRAMVNVQFTVSDADVATLPAPLITRAATVGMVRTATGFVMRVPAAQMTISDGTHSAVTDDQGYFTLPTSATGRSANTLNVVTEKQLVPLTSSASRASGNTATWEMDIAYFNCCTAMQPTSGSTSITASRDIHDGRCLDYNGWYSDHQNYSLSQNPAGALKNFIGSDCFWALPWCCIDHLWSGGCMARHGGCSHFIGHSQNEHWHN